MRIKKKQIHKELANYFVDTTGLLVASTPVFAAMEVFVSNMPVDVSLETRLKMTQLSYLGLGWAYGKGRDLSKKALKVTEQSKAWQKISLDIGYNVTFNAVISFPIYLSSGANLQQALIGTEGACLLSTIAGPLNGYGIDTFRDLIGTKPTTRIPQYVQNMNTQVKKALAIGLVGASIGLTAGIYKIKNGYSKPPQVITEATIQPSKQQQEKTHISSF